MGLLFFKQRPVRKFDHKPIYWDPRKEDLENRVKNIRNEMIRKGEIEGEIEEIKKEDWVESEARERISRSLFSHTDHLNSQRRKGMDKQARTDKTIKLIIMLMALIAISWYLYGA